MVDWIGLIVPLAYITVLAGSLTTFASLYRKRKTVKAASLAPWFPAHIPRNIYLSLLHLEPEPGKEKAPTVPDSVLKAALLHRATEDIFRIIQIRNAKQALSILLQRGSVGDDLWQRFSRAEQEIEEEAKDVVNEANAFVPGWGQNIFQTANEMAANAKLRKRVEDIQSQAASERQWWEERRANIQSSFLEELDAPGAGAATATKQRSGPVMSEKQTSDEDGVIVEADGPTAASKGSTRKKKGKK
ncbi:MAG: hypothetical protein M1825_002961 [Sarcosagium campestre]|nr:MAG: hypothetical protein M1825_002961 [Sarcosagium campestre]